MKLIPGIDQLNRMIIYPNEETLNDMSDQSLLRNLEEAGDDLTKKRRVEHWFYFISESEMNRFENKVLKKGFEVQKMGKHIEPPLPYEALISRMDHVDVNSIYPVSSGLRKLAMELGGI